MANNKEEAGKGMPKPGEMSAAKRPYATIDLKATEVEGRDPVVAGSGPKSSTSAAAEAKSTGKPDAKGAESKAAEGGARAAPPVGASGTNEGQKEGNAAPSSLGSLAGRRRATRLLTYLAAGAVGGLLVLGGAQLLMPDRAPVRGPELNDLSRRLADLESVLGTRPNSGLRARVEELGRSLGTLAETQAKLARDTKALETKVGSGQEIPQELVGRLTRLEDMLGAMSEAGPAGQSPQAAAFAGRLAELQKMTREAAEAAKAGLARVDTELSAVRTQAGGLLQRLDGLKGEVEERMRGAAKAADVGPLAGKLATLEQELQAFVRSEADRNANAARVLLTLELANLKRAIDRGQSYVEDLARVRKVAGPLDLKPLERYMREGVPTPAELGRSFGPAANAMLDAEAEKTDATIVDRLLSGARGIVRVRKVGHAADDTSVEAVVGRMETALKEGHLDDVLANAKKLPPKAALAGEDWVRKVQARQAVEQALADVETALKTSFSAGQAAGKPAGSDSKR